MQYDLSRCLCVVYLITGGVAEAIIEFLNVAHEIIKKHHVVNLALFNSFSQISRLLDAMLNIASATLLLLPKPICCKNLRQIEPFLWALGVGAGVCSPSSSYIAFPSVWSSHIRCSDTFDTDTIIQFAWSSLTFLYWCTQMEKDDSDPLSYRPKNKT